MSTLTEEQKSKIAENKKKAMERLEQRKLERALLPTIGSPISPIPKKQNVNGKPVSVIFNFETKPNNVQKKPMINPFDTNQNAAPKPLINPFDLAMRPSTSNTNTFNPLQGYKPKVTVDMEVCSPTEIEIRIAPYLDEVKNTIKSFKTAKFDPENKRWTVGFPDYHALARSLKIMTNVECRVNDIPRWTHYVFTQKGKMNQPPTQTDIDSSVFSEKIEQTLLQKLFPYQRIGVAFGLERKGRILIADEMGLGKSLQALAISRAYSDEWPLLIVCPASVKYAWKQQIQQFLPTVTNITIIEKGSDKIPGERSSNTVIIMSYDQMVNRENELRKSRIYVIIFDESHLLKDIKTKRTKVALELARNAERRILLSGTPALSRPSELFSQVRLVDPNIFTNWTDFATRYCELKQGKYGVEAKGATYLNELSTILKYTVMIRRLKKDVLHDLPAKTRELLYLSGDKIKTQMGELKKSREAYTTAEKSKNSELMKNALMTFYAETGVCKSDTIADYIIEKYFYKGAPPVKLLLFAHHSTVLDIFCMRFALEKVNHIRIDGNTKGTMREANCKTFQEDPNCQVAVLSITAAGTGITLTAANKVIFAELYWNPGIFFQAEDRAHRVGQKSSVFVQYILARDTADDLIWPKIQEKILVVGNLSLNNETLSSINNCERIVNDERKITDFFTILEQQ